MINRNNKEQSSIFFFKEIQSNKMYIWFSYPSSRLSQKLVEENYNWLLNDMLNFELQMYTVNYPIFITILLLQYNEFVNYYTQKYTNLLFKIKLLFMIDLLFSISTMCGFYEFWAKIHDKFYIHIYVYNMIWRYHSKVCWFIK